MHNYCIPRAHLLASRFLIDFVCVCVCVCACVYLGLCVHMCVYVCVCVCVYVCGCMCACVCVRACILYCLCVCLSGSSCKTPQWPMSLTHSLILCSIRHQWQEVCRHPRTHSHARTTIRHDNPVCPSQIPIAGTMQIPSAHIFKVTHLLYFSFYLTHTVAPSNIHSESCCVRAIFEHKHSVVLHIFFAPQSCKISCSLLGHFWFVLLTLYGLYATSYL